MRSEPPRPIDLAQVRLRPAVGLERRAAIMLLPDAVRGRLGNEYWLAALESPLRVLGAAASLQRMTTDLQTEFHVDIHVVAPYRRQGIGRAILQRLREEARRTHATSMMMGIDALRDEGARGFLANSGFELADRLSTFETDTARLAEFVLPRRDWLVARGEVPVGARVVPLREADLPAVARLHADYLGGTSERLLENLRQLLAGPTADDNCVLLVDDRVAGLLLGSTIDGLTRIESSIVDPAYRGRWTGGGWANLMMMAERLEWARQRGSQRCRFSSLEAASPTRKLAAQAGAVRVAVEEMFRLTLD